MGIFSVSHLQGSAVREELICSQVIFALDLSAHDLLQSARDHGYPCDADTCGTETADRDIRHRPEVPWQRSNT